VDPLMLTALLDDAALFPPGNAPMAEAIAAHLARRDEPDGAYVGPFVCPGSRLAELAEVLGDATIAVSLVGDLPLPATFPAGVTVVAVELADLSLLPDVPRGVRVFVERPWGSELDVPSGALLKLRCGGAYVPSACQLGTAIRRCVDDAQPFKLTAGLHHAIRTSGEHGLLNVLAAVDTALRGDDPVPVLLADDAAALTVRDPQAVRALLLSVGTCSIDEPLTELRALGVDA
jgi:hypothetical protein